MDIALKDIALPDLINKITELLINLGYKVRILNEKKVVIQADQIGHPFGSSRQVLLQVRPEEIKTRIDVTAIIENKKRSRFEEEIVEETIIREIRENFPQTN